MQLYEIVFIARQDLQIQEIQQISIQYKEDIKKSGGVLKVFEYLGFRPLSYEIKKNKKGHYLFYLLTITPSLIKKLEDKLKFREDIIKYVVFKSTRENLDTSLMKQKLI